MIKLYREDLPGLPDKAAGLVADGYWGLFKKHEGYILHAPGKNCAACKQGTMKDSYWALDAKGNAIGILANEPVLKEAQPVFVLIKNQTPKIIFEDKQNGK